MYHKLAMNYFFELIQVALGRREALSDNPSLMEWHELYEEAERQAVVGVLMGALEHLPKEQRPPQGVLLQWIGVTQMIEQQNKTLNEAAAQLTRIFKNGGKRSCVLKGQGLARLYPEPLRRQPGDIDLWIEGGRKSMLKFLKDSFLGIGKVVIHHVDARIIEGIDSEIHFIPIWMYNPVHNHRLQNFLKRMQTDN